MACRVVQWLALLVRIPVTQGLFCGVDMIKLCRFSPGFLPHTKNMLILFGDSKLPVGVPIFLSLYFSPATSSGCTLPLHHCKSIKHFNKFTSNDKDSDPRNNKGSCS